MTKIILAHDSFTQIGGAERVVEAFHELYPEASVYTLVKDENVSKFYPGWKIKSSWVQFFYNFYPRFQHLFPLVPLILPFFKTEQADVLLSSSSAFVKGITKPNGSIHINYCHTPTRFIWQDKDYALGELNVLLRPLASLYLKWLQIWDYNKAQNVDHYIANSLEVQKRIKQFYKRDSVVIQPFVDTEFWKPTKPKGNYFLLAGRLQPYKNNELVIKLFTELGLPLRVAGSGRQEKYLRSIAGKNIEFLGRVTDEQLRDEYSGALAYIFPQLEDFGLMPLEAASSGTASIGLDKGGSLETIIQGKTGELYSGTAEDLKRIITTWDAAKYKQDQLMSHAKQFDKQVFKQKISDFIAKVTREKFL